MMEHPIRNAQSASEPSQGLTRASIELRRFTTLMIKALKRATMARILQPHITAQPIMMLKEIRNINQTFP